MTASIVGPFVLARAASLLSVAAALVAAIPVAAGAGDPSVVFDFARTVECRELPAEDFPQLYPGEKVIEATLLLSVHLLAGDATRVEELRVELTDPDRRMRVIDFSPQTKLESSFSQDIEYVKTVEQGQTLGLSLGGQLPTPIGGAIANVTPSATTGMTNREIVTEKQCRIPPKLVAVAAGTIDEAHGVAFKLRPSPQTTLEGMHEFTVRLVVSEKWRGDSLRVACTASGASKVLWVKQRKTWASTVAETALYLAGDPEARQAARRYVRE